MEIDTNENKTLVGFRRALEMTKELMMNFVHQKSHKSIFNLIRCYENRVNNYKAKLRINIRTK